jgi:hypothetical protein
MVEADGALSSRPKVSLDAAHAWFRDPTWQAGEKEAEGQRNRGEGPDYTSGEDFLESLDATG